MILDLLNKNKDILYHYSQFSFLPKGNKDLIFQNTILKNVEDLTKDKDVQLIKVSISGHIHIFFVKYLKWDSNYFNVKTLKLYYILYDHEEYNTLKLAIASFKQILFNKENIYCFSEIPSEDIFTIQALNENGFKLVESRLTYYLDLNNHNFERYEIRQANVKDISNLKQVAYMMRNKYDRFHAESKFNLIKSDEFLATYIEESIKGLADFVIVPNEKNVNPDAFLTANYLKKDWEIIGENISKMVLSAVSSETCKGWYIKLISEMAYHLKDIGANYAFMHPATTNKAVIHTYERLGCKYGKCVHILTYFS